MKIAQICFSGTGGHTSVVFSLVAADNLKKHEWLIGFIGNEPLSDENAWQSKKFYLTHKHFLFRSGIRIRAWFKLYRWLKDERPMSIICHSTSMILPCFLYSIVHSSKLICVEHQANAHKNISDWVFGFFSMLLASKVIILTPTYLSELKKAYGLCWLSSRFSVIPNGIDLNIFSFNKNNLTDFSQVKEVTLGMAARFAKPKRQKLLIDLVRHLNQTQSDYTFKLSFAGDGPNYNDCQLFADQREVSSIVSFHGFLNESELIEWFRQIDLYVHATDGETLSTALLQAMSLGLPILASNVAGVTDLLHQEDSYGATAINTVINFAEKTLELVYSPDQHKQAIKMGYKKVARDYSNQKMLERYLAVLTKF
jgi:glycosyltransferase involved in cell wall biosynthesis